MTPEQAVVARALAKDGYDVEIGFRKDPIFCVASGKVTYHTAMVTVKKEIVI